MFRLVSALYTPSPVTHIIWFRLVLRRQRCTLTGMHEDANDADERHTMARLVKIVSRGKFFVHASSVVSRANTTCVSPVSTCQGCST